MILWKLTHLRTLDSKFSSPISQENTMQWILKRVILHYKFLHFFKDNWTNTHDVTLDLYLDLIFYRKKLSNCIRNKITCASVDEFSLFARISKYCITVFVFATQTRRLNYYKFHIVEHLHILDFHVI